MSNLSILIVDDHPLFRMGLKYALMGAGFDVLAEASNGLEGIDMAEKYQPEVILLDVKMPKP